MNQLPVACTLTPDELRYGRDGLLPGLVAAAAVRAELADGIRLEFAATAENLTRIARVLERERQCCRFLRFMLTVPPDGRPFVLEATGPPGTRELLAGIAADARDSAG